MSSTTLNIISIILIFNFGFVFSVTNTIGPENKDDLRRIKVFHDGISLTLGELIGASLIPIVLVPLLLFALFHLSARSMGQHGHGQGLGHGHGHGVTGYQEIYAQHSEINPVVIPLDKQVEIVQGIQNLTERVSKLH